MGEWSKLNARQKAEVIKFAIGNGVSDINTIRDTYNIYAEGGSIHIKHPGRLTALKKRTGKTEAELWKTGSAAVRKMITFARNSRKWKHDDGGYLEHRFEDGGDTNREFLPSNNIQNKQVWLNKGTKFQKQMPGTVNVQNIVDVLSPSGGDIQYVWDSPEHDSYSAFYRNPDYRAPFVPSITVGQQALSVSPISTPKINVSIPKPKVQFGYTKKLIRNENLVPMETGWNPGYGYETFRMDNSPYYGIKYYSVPGSINAAEGTNAVLDSSAMWIPIQELNSRVFDYKMRHKDWGEFNPAE